MIVESYDSASNLRFDKNAIILRFDSRFDSASNYNTNLIFCFEIKIRLDIRFDILQILRFDSRFDSFECKLKDSIQYSINDIVENGTLDGGVY